MGIELPGLGVPHKIRELATTIAWFPLALIHEASRIVEFWRVMRGAAQAIKFTPMITVKRRYWSRLHSFCDQIGERMVRHRTSFMGIHMPKECQMGRPCISLWSDPHEHESFDIVEWTWKIFTVELLHHIFSRIDRSDKIDAGWENIHGSGPLPKLIRPGPPYSRRKLCHGIIDSVNSAGDGLDCHTIP